MLPVAHIGHYLWVFYLLPVLFVVLGIVKTTLSERRRRQEDEDRAGGVEGGGTREGEGE
jgi:cytochrome c-type biogenesis protein CcmH/NrfF